MDDIGRSVICFRGIREKGCPILKDSFGGEPLCARCAYQPCSHNQYIRDISSIALSNKIAKATSWMETT